MLPVIAVNYRQLEIPLHTADTSCTMNFAQLIEQTPRDPNALDTLLAQLGFFDPSEKSSAAPIQNAISGHRFITPAGVKPKTSRRKKVSVAAPSQMPIVAPNSTQRAQRVLETIARDEVERAAWLQIVDAVMQDCARASDPFVSLFNLSRLSEAVSDRALFFVELQDDDFRARLCRLLSFSQSLADSLIQNPHWLDLHAPAQPISRPQLRILAQKAMDEFSTPNEKLDALRRFRQQHFLRIGTLDLESQTWRDEADFAIVTQQISDLAQVCVQKALQVLAPDNPPFCVLIMGKGGARELNYSSDIDLIFLHNGESEAMSALGRSLLRELGATTASGTLYRVDMRLRPEGSSGPLTTSFGYALSYYESFAAPWEWQALIKARAIAGDAKLGRRFLRFTRGVTWARRADDDHLQAIVDMKRRSEATADGRDNLNVKSGPGGIRDAEWIVQQLQMMVGPQHPRARVAATLDALQVLAELDALSFEQARELRDGYLFLRVLEHRLQLWQERAIRNLPTSEAEKAALARRVGCRARGASAARWLDEEHARHQKSIRALCEHLFWGWRQSSREAATTAVHGLVPDADAEMQTRLNRLQRGSENQPLPAPLARQIGAVLPAALQHLNSAAQPARALANLERLCDNSGNRLSVLRDLAASPDLSSAIFAILGGAREVADTLVDTPELLDLAAQRSLLARGRDENEARAACRDYCLTFRDRHAALRRWKHREMLRIALRDLSVRAPTVRISAGISYLCRACLELALEEIGRELHPNLGALGFAVLGMGKLGGAEMHPASDADVIWVHDAPADWENAGKIAAQLANEITHYLGAHSGGVRVWEVDARLRPEGRNGILAPSVEGFVHYFERQSGGLSVWERQALTRARFVAGDARTGARLMALIRHVAYPETWQAQWSDELRHIKHRVETERARAGSETIYDVKLGRGALSDIEWAAQWLAMKHGAQFLELQRPNTLQVLAAAKDAQLLGESEERALREAYEFLQRAQIRLHWALDNPSAAQIENSIAWQSWAGAVFPELSREAACEEFANQWKMHTSAVRNVFERVRDAL